jgi:hypothetical protein
MTTISLKANELSETNVQIVSMVKRGANRIPFRIVKEDNEDMLNLDKIAAKGFVKSEQKGGVLAVIVNKTADVEAVAAALANTGLKLEKGEEGENTIVFKQEGISEFDVGMIKLDDDVIVAVSGLQKGFSAYDWQNTDFATVFATEGFYPSLRTATDAMETTISNILYKSENKAEISTKVTKCLSDFGSLVNTLVANIPEAAVKADEALKSETYVAAKKTAGTAACDPAMTEADKKKMKTPAKKEDEPKVEDTAKGDEAKPEAKDGEAVKEAPKVEKTEDNADLLAKIGDLITQGIEKALAPVTASVDALKTDFGKVNSRVEEVAATAKKADQAIKGTVTISSAPDRSVTKKTDSEGTVPPPLDTAFMKNV